METILAWPVCIRSLAFISRIFTSVTQLLELLKCVIVNHRKLQRSLINCSKQAMCVHWNFQTPTWNLTKCEGWEKNDQCNQDLKYFIACFSECLKWHEVDLFFTVFISLSPSLSFSLSLFFIVPPPWPRKRKKPPHQVHPPPVSQK